MSRDSLLISEHCQQRLVIRLQQKRSPIDEFVELLDSSHESQALLLDLPVLLFSRTQRLREVHHDLLGSISHPVCQTPSDTVL